MAFTAEHKIEVEKHIVDAVITGLEKQTITADDAREAARFILDRVHDVDTEEKLTNFLKELSAKWSIFANLYTIELGEVKEENEQAIAEKVAKLTQSGKVEEALSLAKSATTQKGVS